MGTRAGTTPPPTAGREFGRRLVIELAVGAVAFCVFFFAGNHNTWASLPGAAGFSALTSALFEYRWQRRRKLEHPVR